MKECCDLAGDKRHAEELSVKPSLFA